MKKERERREMSGRRRPLGLPKSKSRSLVLTEILGRLMESAGCLYCSHAWVDLYLFRARRRYGLFGSKANDGLSKVVASHWTRFVLIRAVERNSIIPEFKDNHTEVS